MFKKVLLAVAELAGALALTTPCILAQKQIPGLPEIKPHQFDQTDPRSCIGAQGAKVFVEFGPNQSRTEFYSCDGGGTDHAVIHYPKPWPTRTPIALGLVASPDRLKEIGKKNLSIIGPDPRENGKCEDGTPAVTTFRESSEDVCAFVCGSLIECASKYYALRSQYQTRFRNAKARVSQNKLR